MPRCLFRAILERIRRPRLPEAAPEVHHIGGTFWIAYSMNGHGTGLPRSTAGRAEGPYEDVGLITARDGDAALLEDDDGPPGHRSRSDILRKVCC